MGFLKHLKDLYSKTGDQNSIPFSKAKKLIQEETKKYQSDLKDTTNPNIIFDTENDWNQINIPVESTAQHYNIIKDIITIYKEMKTRKIVESIYLETKECRIQFNDANKNKNIDYKKKGDFSKSDIDLIVNIYKKCNDLKKKKTYREKIRNFVSKSRKPPQ